MYIYWPKYEHSRLGFWGNSSDIKQWQTFCKAYSSLECKDVCWRYWSGNASIHDVLEYAGQCKDVNELEYLAEVLLHEKGKLPVEYHTYICDALDKISSRLPSDSFVVSLLQLEKNGQVRIKKESLQKLKNFVLLVEILGRKGLLVENGSVIRTVCAGDKIKNLILEVFLRVSRDERVRFFAMKDEEELWIQYVPFLKEEYEKKFPVVKNESGKTWPWTDENNYSALAAYIKPVNDGTYFSIEFCTENVEAISSVLESFSLREDCNYVDNRATIRLKESNISNDIEVKTAVNEFIDAFCDIGVKIMEIF